MIKVIVQLKESSQPIIYEKVINTYTKGGLFCIYVENGIVYKHPLESICRIKEEYGYHGR